MILELPLVSSLQEHKNNEKAEILLACSVLHIGNLAFIARLRPKQRQARGCREPEGLLLSGMGER
jgi:hypothetical protein